MFMQKFIDRLPFAKRTWFLYVCFLVRHFFKDNCTQKASSLTYTTLLSIVPILTVILVLFSITPALSEVRGQLEHVIYNNLLPTFSDNIKQHLDSFAQKSSRLGLVGILGVFVTTIMTLITIEDTFNQIWKVSKSSGTLSSFLRYWTMITLTPIVLGVAFGASSAITGLSLFDQRFMGYGIDWKIWAQIASLLVMTAGFVGMYWFIPRTHVPLKNAIKAGIVVAVLFELLKHLFGVVISNFTSYEAIYGAFAIVPVFLMWLYLSWNVILLGVEISYTLTIFDDKHTPTRPPLLNLLDMLHLTYQHYQEGQSVSESELRAVLGRKELPHWHRYVDKLVDNNLITHTTDGNYVLRMDLESVSVWQFYKTMSCPLPTQDELSQYQQIEHELWLDRLHHQLTHINQTAQDELGLSVAELFRGTPSKVASPNTASDLSPATGEDTLHTPKQGMLSKTAFYLKNPKQWFKKPNK